MRFLFDCGVFEDVVLDLVVVQAEEIAESRVLPVKAALPLLSGPVRRRVRAGCASKRVRYLEDGRPVPGIRLSYAEAANEQAAQLACWTFGAALGVVGGHLAFRQVLSGNHAEHVAAPRARAPRKTPSNEVVTS
jgi:hypothetical protein